MMINMKQINEPLKTCLKTIQGLGNLFNKLVFSKSCPFKHIILEYMQALYDLNSFVCYSATAFSLFKKINNFVNRKRPKMGAFFQCQCLFSKNKFPSTIEFYLPINLCMLFRIWIDKSQMMTWKKLFFFSYQQVPDVWALEAGTNTGF